MNHIRALLGILFMGLDPSKFYWGYKLLNSKHGYIMQL